MSDDQLRHPQAFPGEKDMKKSGFHNGTLIAKGREGSYERVSKMVSKGGQQGYTLVEVLIAITIFAVGLLSLAGMQVTAIRTNSTANTLTAATALAEGIMEEILAWSAGDPRIASDTADVDWDFGGGQTTKFLNGAGVYSAVYRVDADAPVANVSTITITVSGSGRQIVLTGYKQYVD